MVANTCQQEVTDHRGTEKKLEAAGWGLFFVWVGTAFIAGIGWGAGLIGVGVVILLGQVARRYFGVKTEIVPILLGFFFVLGGVWELLTVQFSLVPVLCVVAGLALMVSAIARKARD